MSIEQLAASPDPWTPPSASIEAHRIVNPAARIAPFEADEWPLGALPATKGAVDAGNLGVAGLPEPWTSVTKWLAYRWLNFETPAAIRDRAGSRHVDFPAPSTVRQRVGDLRAVVHWLHDQGVTVPSEIDDDHLTDLVLFLRARSMRPAAIDQRLGVFKHWFAQSSHLPPSLRLPHDLQTDIAPERRARSGENKTRRIRQATIGPLIWWCNLLIDHADLIFEVVEHANVPLVHPDPTATKVARARSILDRFVESGDPVPTWRSGSGEMASAYLAWKYGASSQPLTVVLSQEYATRLSIATDADCPIIGLSAEVPDDLQPLLQFYDAVHSGDGGWPLLIRMLQTACLILTAYLTGMRPEEVRRLRPGCCPDPMLMPGGGVRHLIHGTVTKRQAKADGIRSGAVDEVDAVWATIPLTARAIAVAERVRAEYATGSEYLFNSPYGKTMLDSATATSEMAQFVDTVNIRIGHHQVAAPTIPADVHGPITLRRFRRTLAWYIRNQPEGEVTLAVQYQQVGTLVGAGYAAAGSTGWADLLDEEGRETRRNVAENLSRELLNGAGISGPAAARAAQAAVAVEGVSFLPDSDARRLLNAPGLQIYDNRTTLTLCMFDPDRALCQRISTPGSSVGIPNLLGCRRGCTNIAMTDSQAEAMTASAQQLRLEAAASPRPMRNRLMDAADEAEERAAQHWETRVVPTTPIDEGTA